MNYFKRREIKLKESDYCEDTQELIILFRQFIKQMRGSSRKREDTMRGYICTFETFIKLCPEISCKTINEITVNHFFEKLENRERPVGRLSKSGKPTQTKRGVEDSTIATYRSKLNKFFTWLVNRNELKENPFWRLEYPKVEYGNIKFLNKKEVNKIFFVIGNKIEWKNNFIEKRNMAIFSILLNCGLRKGELINLKITDIDFDDRTLKVRGETSKSKIDRVIPLNSDVFGKIRRYMQERKNIKSDEINLFINEKGEKFKVHGLKHLIEKVKRVSGINCHLHRFRHTFAMNYLAQTGNQFALKQLLGHKDLRMTQSYIRYIPDDSLREGIEKICGLENLL